MSVEKIIYRDIERVWTSERHQQSPIHTNSAVLPPGHWEAFDPFVLMFEDWFQKGSFDVHPHRGIETVTYVIEGTLEHFDNNAGDFELHAGDVQWMTAGSGVIHKEDPKEGETVHSLQLWVNLPSDEKMTEPRYQNLWRQDMPVRHEKGAEIVVFSGSSLDVKANTLNHVPVTMVELNLEPGSAVEQDLPGDYNGFIYVVEGEGVFGANNTEAQKGQVLWLGAGKKDEPSVVTVEAKSQLKAVLCAGRPLHETIVARGPFVMNTEEQIQEAYQDYMSGKFVK